MSRGKFLLNAVSSSQFWKESDERASLHLSPIIVVFLPWSVKTFDRSRQKWRTQRRSKRGKWQSTMADWKINDDAWWRNSRRSENDEDNWRRIQDLDGFRSVRFESDLIRPPGVSKRKLVPLKYEIHAMNVSLRSHQTSLDTRRQPERWRYSWML